MILIGQPSRQLGAIIREISLGGLFDQSHFDGEQIKAFAALAGHF